MAKLLGFGKKKNKIFCFALNFSYLCTQICKFNKIMAYTRLTAAEAAALIKNGDHIAMSGFTPAGVAKATTKELAKLAVAEHEAGREFKVAILVPMVTWLMHRQSSIVLPTRRIPISVST